MKVTRIKALLARTKQQNLQLQKTLVECQGQVRWLRPGKKGGCMDKKLQHLFDKTLVANHARQVEGSIKAFIVAGDAFQAKCAEAKGVLIGTARELRSH